MKLLAIFAVGLTAALAPPADGETSAPPLVGGNSAVVVIASGSGQLSATGSYRIMFSASSSNYSISTISGALAASTGTYTYTRTGLNRARLTLTDGRPRSVAIVHNLEFSTATSAAYSASSETGSQAGVLVLEKPPTECGLANVSFLLRVPSGSQVLQGFVLDRPTRVLVRVAGPALASFGVNGVLPNPRLTVMQGNMPLASNDDWASTISNYDAVWNAGAKAGAFPFSFGSRDAAVVLDLVAGAYTCLVSDTAGAAGEVLVECYRVPE
jgi:hypothetical protein